MEAFDPTPFPAEYAYVNDGTLAGSTITAKDGYVLPGLSGSTLSVEADPKALALLSMVPKVNRVAIQLETDEGTYQVVSDERATYPLHPTDFHVIRPDGKEMFAHAFTLEVNAITNVAVYPVLHTAMVRVDVAVTTDEGQTHRVQGGPQHDEIHVTGLDMTGAALRYGVGPLCTLLRLETYDAANLFTPRVVEAKQTHVQEGVGDMMADGT